MADDPNIPNVFGWDASDYDWQRGPMDLAAAARDGIEFFTHKATEATWTKHVHYGEAMRRARDAGIPVLGAYHVVRSPADAEREVDYCLAYVNAQTPWWRDFPCWFWQVDLEKWSYDNVPAAEGEAFADIIEAKTGRKAVIYASKGQYDNALNGTSHQLWNANYGNNNVGHYRQIYANRGGDSGAGWVNYSGRMPIFWQYGSRTTIGSQSTCDANAFRGTLAQLRALLEGDEMVWDDVTGGDLNPSNVPAGRVLLGTNIAAYGAWNESKAMRAELVALRTVIEHLATGKADTVAILAGVDERLAAHRAAIEADTRDAVADFAEGGAPAVRADA